ncbi:MAG TPA: DNA polymerase III subunit epsilon [Gammaproteobacteria bacterium]|nr:DNA polymerase III subunit epsilon [Gammaproteobacteria bacterium]
MRQIVLDTETTGLEPSQGHRIIEIGCVELVNRRLTGNQFHHYLQPDRPIDPGAIEVHGITNEFLVDKPRFKDIADEFIDFIKGAELIIHNAAFDVGFINSEFRRLDENLSDIARHCKVLCTLILARQLHPGQKNTLDALCKRYTVDNSQRQKHGALLDAEILADVYLAMTGGQASLSLDASHDVSGLQQHAIRRVAAERPRLPVLQAAPDELTAHQGRLDAIDKASGGQCVWKKLQTDV